MRRARMRSNQRTQSTDLLTRSRHFPAASWYNMWSTDQMKKLPFELISTSTCGLWSHLFVSLSRFLSDNETFTHKTGNNKNMCYTRQEQQRFVTSWNAKSVMQRCEATDTKKWMRNSIRFTENKKKEKKENSSAAIPPWSRSNCLRFKESEKPYPLFNSSSSQVSSRVTQRWETFFLVFLFQRWLHFYLLPHLSFSLPIIIEYSPAPCLLFWFRRGWK